MIPIESRFWEKVDKSGECWIWTGSRSTAGYGLFRYKGKSSTVAHRVSWEMANGPIPKGLWVLHKCDVRLCVNPGHLFLGDHAANMRDMVGKGRSKHGDPPPAYSLDRIDRNGNYEPSNCRWADAKTQARNSRKIRLIEFNGETKALTDWAAQIGITSSRLCGRIKSMGLEKALTKPKTNHTITARAKACQKS